MFDLILPILNTGAVGAMLIMVWRWSVSKDRKSYKMIEAQNRERRRMYDNMSDLVKEVTVALTNKNHTDDKMADAIIKLTDKIKDNTTRES